MSGSLLNIAGSALSSHHTSLQTLGHNIANANTPGFTRQSASLTAADPSSVGRASVGTGVRVSAIVRQRNDLLDLGARSSAASAQGARMEQEQLEQIEAMFNEPSDQGMGQALDDFFNVWSELASSPTSGGARAVVRVRGERLAQLFNTFDGELSKQRTATIDQVRTTLDQVNTLARQVAQLNGEILASEARGQTNNDLRDRRDLALDELAGLVGAEAQRQQDGQVSVNVGDFRLVEGNRFEELRQGYEPGSTTGSQVDTPIRLQSLDGRGVSRSGGKIGALVSTVNGAIPEVRSRLDALAKGLVTAVNALHRQGFVFAGPTPPGTAAGDFFAPATASVPVRAGSIRLDPAIQADANKIAASRNANAPANNELARGMSAMRDTADTVAWTAPDGTVDRGSFVGFFRSAMTQLGITAKAADDDAQLYETMAEQSATRRQKANGVNVDEELMQVVQVQQAYQAAAKLVKSADELVQMILQMV